MGFSSVKLIIINWLQPCIFLCFEQLYFKSLLTSQKVHQAGTASASQGYPQHFAGTHLYTWVERGTVRVKCLAQEHNTLCPQPGPEPGPLDWESSTLHHEATAPPQLNNCSLYKTLSDWKMQKMEIEDASLKIYHNLNPDFCEKPQAHNIQDHLPCDCNKACFNCLRVLYGPQCKFQLYFFVFN